MNKAIFFDKDGTLVKNIPYNTDPEKIDLEQGADIALKLLKDFYQFHIVTNQSGVALGYFDLNAVSILRKRIEEIFNSHEVFLSDFYFCPHHPAGLVEKYRQECECRKPSPKLLFKAAKEHHLDLSHSWMIGDILDDIECGKRAGCQTILLNRGNETEWNITAKRIPDFIASDLLEASRIILKEEGII